MEVICELMRLKPERVKDYVDLHDHTWPELVQAIRDCGFLEEHIYLQDSLVIVVMKCEDFHGSLRRLGSMPVFQRWTALVRAMLIEDEIEDLSPIWDLSKL
jgi:L-rhamnose mutarotase